MNYRIMVLGGYGNFGKRIVETLARDLDLELVVAGRDGRRAAGLAGELRARLEQDNVSSQALDGADESLDRKLAAAAVKLLINTAGPFQRQGHAIPSACIRAGAHYIDLADDRRFVCDIASLDDAAKRKRVSVISGASSVPGLSSAVVDELGAQFAELESIRFGIAPGNRAERGTATIGAILSYTGQPFPVWIDGAWKTAYGWQEIHRHRFGHGIGKRWLANCDIPDLELFPERYPTVRTVRFSAGLELGVLHWAMNGMSWLARLRLIRNWAAYVKPIAAMSRWFLPFGTADGAMFVELGGLDRERRRTRVTWKLIARRGCGPYIPTIASIILARKLAQGHALPAGAYPCLGLFTVDEFMREVSEWEIEQFIER